jgi:propionate CoA-transferase
MTHRDVLVPDAASLPGAAGKDKSSTARGGVDLIQDGDVVALSGFGGIGAAEEILEALAGRFLETGRPRGITLYVPAMVGDGVNRGTNQLAQDGLVTRIIAGFYGVMPRLAERALANEIEGYNLPLGTLVQMVRDAAGAKPGTLTSIGLGTFVDPREQGGKLNARSTDDLVELLEIDGKDVLAYKTPQIDVAIIRASTADRTGNLSIEDEAVPLDLLSMATAAQNSGGVVIAQVARLVESGSLRPSDVAVPGCLIDSFAVTENPSNHMQTYVTQADPALSGRIRVPIASDEAMALDARKIIARRAAQELIPNCVVNLGVGMPEGVARVAAEEGLLEHITLTAESGVIGGMPQSGATFGTALNADCLVGMPQQFDFYDGGGMDIAFLGLAQADRKGNLNVSKFGPKLPGCGGFINISQPARKVVFMGTLTAGGLRVEVGDGLLRIKAEGRAPKFVEQVEQVTFSGRQATGRGQPVLYVTERCVFDLCDDGLRLIEVAPGLDIERDIVAHMGFRPIIEDPPSEMDARIFRAESMDLKAEILGVAIEDRVVYDAGQEILFVNFENLRVDSLEIIHAFEEHVGSLLGPLGKKVGAIVNYEGFDVLPEFFDAYLRAVRSIGDRYFEGVTRYTTSAFMRMKLGNSLEKRGLAAHLYESPVQAAAALRRSNT